jgi:hypothetical protein
MKLTLVEKDGSTELHFKIDGFAIRWRPKSDELANMWETFREYAAKGWDMIIESTHDHREPYYIELESSRGEVHATVWTYEMYDNMYFDFHNEYVSAEKFLEITAALSSKK